MTAPSAVVACRLGVVVTHAVGSVSPPSIRTSVPAGTIRVKGAPAYREHLGIVGLGLPACSDQQENPEIAVLVRYATWTPANPQISVQSLNDFRRK